MEKDHISTENLIHLVQPKASHKKGTESLWLVFNTQSPLIEAN